jgi:hypothetical protein
MDFTNTQYLIFSLLLLLCSIFFFAFRMYRAKTRISAELKDEVLRQDVDFKNIINSSFHADKLWDEMRKKCHPDRFGGDEIKMMLANELQTAINENKNNIKVLEELKMKAEQELGIKFN